jgi:condensin complex subunit 1
MARYFLSELQKKEPRCIANVIGDIVANVGKDGPDVLPVILVSQDKGSPDLVVQKLIRTLGKTSDEWEARNISHTILLLPTLPSTMKILLDEWEEYRKQLENPLI